MEKDIGRIPKNPDTDIVVRLDDFGGKRGLTIREFVKSERYTGFTKAGTRIAADKFKLFKQIINSIDEKDFETPPEQTQLPATPPTRPAEKKKAPKKQAPKEDKLSEELKEKPEELKEELAAEAF
jgi:ribosomal protein L12E/L44/L45/RPP1/RPP2